MFVDVTVQKKVRCQVAYLIIAFESEDDIYDTIYHGKAFNIEDAILMLENAKNEVPELDWFIKCDIKEEK